MRALTPIALLLCALPACAAGPRVLVPPAPEVGRSSAIYLLMQPHDDAGVYDKLSSAFSKRGYAVLRIPPEDRFDYLICEYEYSVFLTSTVKLRLTALNSREIVYSAEGSGAGNGATQDLVEAIDQALAAFPKYDPSSPGAEERTAAPAHPQVHDTKWRRHLPSPTDIIVIRDSDRMQNQSSTLFERVSPAVVSIRSDRGQGSGFLITRDGLALTNYHVVHQQGSLSVKLRDGRELSARVVRAQKEADVALIEIGCELDCPTLTLEQASDLQVGADVFAMGTPLDIALSHSLTKGVISGHRLWHNVTLLQIDAAVNPGNSGGPLLDAGTGRVVGIVAAKLVGRGVEGLGFAVAVADACRVLGVKSE